MTEILVIEGDALNYLRDALDSRGTHIYKVSVTDDGGIKIKLNEFMWTAAFRSPDYKAGYAQAQQEHEERLAGTLDFSAKEKVDVWANATEEWHRGWNHGWEAGERAALAAQNHPLDCLYCSAGEGHIHNYQPPD